MARIDLGQLAKLSPATITAITSDLLEQNLIEGIETEEPKAPQSRGRPRSLLRINPDAVCVLAIRITVNRIDLDLANFAGETVRHKEVAFNSAASDGTNFPDFLVKAVRQFIDEADIPPKKLSEIGVASQGVVEVEHGRVAWSPAFRAGPIPIVQPLEEAFDVHCSVSNDTNMITTALHWLDPVKYSGTFAVVMLDYGVGMGLFINNQLFAGANGTAAEFGHSNHIPGGALCRCGRRGCIEAYLSDYALVRASNHLPETTDPREVDAGVSGLAKLIEGAENGDANTLTVFSDAGTVLGYGLARVLAILDPSRIVLTGAAVRGFSFMEKAMYHAMEDALVEDLRRGFKIDVMPWNEDFIRRGLVAEALDRIDNSFVGPKKTAAIVEASPIAGQENPA